MASAPARIALAVSSPTLRQWLKALLTVEGYEVVQREPPHTATDEDAILLMDGEDSSLVIGELPYAPSNTKAMEAQETLPQGFSSRDLLEALGKLLLGQERATAQLEAAIGSLSLSLAARDRETYLHSQRIASYSVALGRRLALSEARLTTLRHAGLLHDLGKLSVPDAILFKAGPLSDEESQVIAQHASLGRQILSPLRIPATLAQAIEHHHERWDGQGYPHRLVGEEIPLLARIIAIVDTYDALTSQRPYKPAFPAYRARAILREEAGRRLDPHLVKEFLASL